MLARGSFEPDDDEELETLARACDAAWNRHADRSGFTPAQRVLGGTHRMPRSLTTDRLPDSARHAHRCDPGVLRYGQSAAPPSSGSRRYPDSLQPRPRGVGYGEPQEQAGPALARRFWSHMLENGRDSMGGSSRSSLEIRDGKPVAGNQRGQAWHRSGGSVVDRPAGGAQSTPEKTRVLGLHAGASRARRVRLPARRREHEATRHGPVGCDPHGGALAAGDAGRRSLSNPG